MDKTPLDLNVQLKNWKLRHMLEVCHFPIHYDETYTLQDVVDWLYVNGIEVLLGTEYSQLGYTVKFEQKEYKDELIESTKSYPIITDWIKILESGCEFACRFMIDKRMATDIKATSYGQQARVLDGKAKPEWFVMTINAKIAGLSDSFYLREHISYPQWYWLSHDNKLRKHIVDLFSKDCLKNVTIPKGRRELCVNEMILNIRPEEYV